MYQVWLKRALVFSHDVLWIPISVTSAYWLRFNLGQIPGHYVSGLLVFTMIALPAHSISFWLFGCYRGIWRFASIPDLIRLLKAVFLGMLLTSSLAFFYSRFAYVPRSAVLLYPILLFVGVAGSRVVARMVSTHRLTFERRARRRALIVGAGQTGSVLTKGLLGPGEFLPVALVDDHPGKKGTDLHGIRVRGTVKDLPELIERLEIEIVLIAMPSAPRHVMNSIVKTCAALQIPCRTVPSMLEVANGSVEVSRLRPVTAEDLLGRDPVLLDQAAISQYLSAKKVLVSGGGGSIGSELCRQILNHNPAGLIILESSEYNLYKIESEVQRHFPDKSVHAVLCDIRLPGSVEHVFKQYGPHVVFHTAAYKHVPLVESNILAAIQNNVLATTLVADAAVKHDVHTFVQVSTDKSVNPTNVMGATKRVAEIYCQMLDTQCQTNFVTTRFGNVLGSAGSVVPLFEKQIREGGPVTVTHPEITRFFMTIPEAVSLILQAGSMAKGGGIYVLDMGEPVRIEELARKLIFLAGLRPDIDIRIEYVGLRPGEKMHEELFYPNERSCSTSHPKLLLATSPQADRQSVTSDIANLAAAVNDADEQLALSSLTRLVPGFKRAGDEIGEGGEAAAAGLRLVK